MKVKKILLLVVIFIIGAIMWWFNWMTPLSNDDYGYMFVLNEPSVRVTNLGQIFRGLLFHYQVQGGRVVAHFLAQLFLLLGDDIFNFLNTAAWLALIYGIVLHVCLDDKRISKRIQYFLLSHFLLWILIPQLGEACLWLDGSANYLWTALILTYALLPYRRAVLSENSQFSARGGVFYLIAGNTSENGALAVWCMMAAYCYLYKKEHNKLPKNMIRGIIWMGIGYLALIAAPGNFNRYTMSVGKQSPFHFLAGIAIDILKCGYKFISNEGIVIVFVILLLMITRYIGEKTVFSYDNIALLLGIAISVGVMTIMPVCPERVFIHSTVLLMILLLSLWNRLDLGDEKKLGLIAGICCIGGVYACGVFEAAGDVLRIKRYNDGIVVQIQEAKEAGIKEVLIDSPPIPNTKYGVMMYFDEDSEQWPNYYWASYYGIDRIAIGKDANEEK